jgi:uncharacterized protein YcbK (DUF882 family)
LGDLTKNFSISEFICKCGCGKENIDAKVVNIAQTIRDYLDEPVRINSGCRCTAYNKKVGGVADSTHISGMAIDLSCDSGSRSIFNAIKALSTAGKIHQIGYCKRYIKKNFVHVDVDTSKRRSVYAEGN